MVSNRIPFIGTGISTSTIDAALAIAHLSKGIPLVVVNDQIPALDKPEKFELNACAAAAMDPIYIPPEAEKTKILRASLRHI